MSERYGLSYVGQTAAQRLALREPASVLATDHARSVRFGDAQHVLVCGDNLEAMTLLARGYAGRVDLAYLDPPYNTGHDFVYRDRFAEDAASYERKTGQRDESGRRLVANPETSGRYHSAWLCMIEPRLRLVHRLLAEHGLLFASIDDHEVAQLRLLLDDVFGPEGFVAQIIVVGNPGGRDYLRIATTHEYLLVYGKQPDAPVRELPRSDRVGSKEDARGRYELRDLRNRNPKFTPKNRPNLSYPIWVDDAPGPGGRHAVGLRPGPGRTEVLPLNSRGEGSVWRWSAKKLAVALADGDPDDCDVVAKKRRDGGFIVYEKSRKTTTKPRSLWNEPELRTERGTARVRQLLGVAAFDHPKPVELLARCLQIGMDRDGLVLDVFAGSGSMADAALTLNAADGGSRRSLSLQLHEPLPADAEARRLGLRTIADVAYARIKAALPDDAGLRVFALSDDPRPNWSAPPDDAPATYLQALIDHEHARAEATPDLWDLALAAGARLDARYRLAGTLGAFVHTGEGELLVVTAPHVRADDLRALDLSPGAHVACLGSALADDAAAMLVAMGCVLHLR